MISIWCEVASIMLVAATLAFHGVPSLASALPVDHNDSTVIEKPHNSQVDDKSQLMIMSLQQQLMKDNEDYMPQENQSKKFPNVLEKGNNSNAFRKSIPIIKSLDETFSKSKAVQLQPNASLHNYPSMYRAKDLSSDISEGSFVIQQEQSNEQQTSLKTRDKKSEHPKSQKGHDKHRQRTINNLTLTEDEDITHSAQRDFMTSQNEQPTLNTDNAEKELLQPEPMSPQVQSSDDIKPRAGAMMRAQAHTNIMYYVDNQHQPGGSLEFDFEADIGLKPKTLKPVQRNNETYRVLKSKGASRRHLGQWKYVQVEGGGGGVSILHEEGAPLPQFQLPSNRRQYMGNRHSDDSSEVDLPSLGTS